MSMDLYYLLYQSHALVSNSSQEHNRILTNCSKNNQRAALTGFLHREGDYFVQMLEGPKDALLETVAKIKQDPRHKDFVVLDEGTLARRYFPDWQMGFVDDGHLSLGELLGIQDGKLCLKPEDPFDLIVFLSSNADCLRETQLAA